MFAKLREEGLECFQYIDVTFVVVDSFETCEKSLRFLQVTLEDLGFTIHPKKSVTIPYRELVFLGSILDSDMFKVFLTQEKIDKLVRAAEDVLRKTEKTIREIASLIGLTIAYSQAFPYGEAHTEQLEIEKVKALALARGDFDEKMMLSPWARADVQWWLENVGSSGKDILVGKADKVLYSDGGRSTGGRWAGEEKLQHINVLELKAIEFALKSLCNEQDKHIKVFTDNMTAVAYVKHQGGVISLEYIKVAQTIWAWAEERRVWSSVAHIP